MRRVLPALLAALALAGCSAGGDDPEDVLAETAENLGEIRSGELDFGILVTPRRGNPFGFELRGPFALARGSGLPVMEVDYTQIASGRRATVTLISTGRRAYARVGDELRPLTREQTQALRSAGAALGGDDDGGGLRELRVDDWIQEPELEDGGEVGGAETDLVRGKLDIVATVNGLAGLARGLGRNLDRIEGREAERLRRATRSTRFELYTGADDRLLRRLTMEADFGLDVPRDLRSALGDVVSAKVRFHLGVTNPNEAVTVEDPAR